MKIQLKERTPEIVAVYFEKAQNPKNKNMYTVSVG